MGDPLKCERCEKVGPDVSRRRQNTAYVNDESNFAVLCDDCQKDADEYWSERWAEYRAGLL